MMIKDKMKDSFIVVGVLLGATFLGCGVRHYMKQLKKADKYEGLDGELFSQVTSFLV